MATIQNGQTCLEARGMEERHNEIVRSDYNLNNAYSSTHPNAISDGDVKGKGTQHGGHTHFLPDCTKPTTTIDYSNFDTFNGGGCYDINGRNGIGGRVRLMNYCLYSSENEYGPNSVSTEQNREDGQYFMGQQIGSANAVCG